MSHGCADLPCLATVGVAQQAGESLDSLMASVDTALYAGKQAGRNRVLLAVVLAVGEIGTGAAAQFP